MGLTVGAPAHLTLYVPHPESLPHEAANLGRSATRSEKEFQRSPRSETNLPSDAGHAIRSQTMGPKVETPARLSVYVPHPESSLCKRLAHGSAIVGLPLASGAVRIYYEGNVVRASNLERYRDKAAQAAGRMLHHYPAGYPTRAREDVDPRELVQVGTIEVRSGRLEITARATELGWWLDPADLADLGFKLEAR